MSGSKNKDYTVSPLLLSLFYKSPDDGTFISMPPKRQTLRSDPRKFVEDMNFQNGPSLFMQYYSYVA